MTTKFDDIPEVETINIDSQNYPKRLHLRLGDKAPKTLYAIGNIDLLNEDSLGFCGARNVSEKGLTIAKDCAEQAVENNKVILSGNARGVDRMVHKTALEAGGKTILILPEGINKFQIVKELKKVWDWKRTLIISEFSPDTNWQTWNAMKRNKTILSLVSAMIVIEAGEKGGTIAAGKDSLKMRIPLFVVNHADMNISLGGKTLIELGGCKLNKSESTGRANMLPIFSEMDRQRLKKHRVITEGELELGSGKDH
jgi:DNA processing protein